MPGTPVTWTPTATDSNSGPLTFQYSVSCGNGAFSNRLPNVHGGHSFWVEDEQTGCTVLHSYIPLARRLYVDYPNRQFVDVRETNIGVLQQQPLAMGATGFGVCGGIPLPAAIGAACLGGMHHDAICCPTAIPS